MTRWIPTAMAVTLGAAAALTLGACGDDDPGFGGGGSGSPLDGGTSADGGGDGGGDGGAADGGASGDCEGLSLCIDSVAGEFATSQGDGSDIVQFSVAYTDDDGDVNGGFVHVSGDMNEDIPISAGGFATTDGSAVTFIQSGVDTASTYSYQIQLEDPDGNLSQTVALTVQ